MYLLLLALVLSYEVIADDWWTIPRTEDEKSYYYVGVSEGREGIDQLQDKAFNKAMGELIREHFGMQIEVKESSVEEIRKQQFHAITKQSSAPLFIKGVGIVKTKEKDLDDRGSRVYVQIQADKNAVREAIRNQTTSPGSDSLNTFGDSNDSKIDLTVKTHPQGAFIHFSHLDRRFTLQGQGDARFFLPRGRYQMVVSMPGYDSVKKEIEVRTQGLEETITLDELNGAIDLEVYPDDARIYFEGSKLPPGPLRAPVGKTLKFQITHPDFFPHETELALEKPETFKKIIKLEPRPSTLSYRVQPSHARIEIDGREVFVNKGKVSVDPGKKRVRVSAPGYFTFEEDVFVGTNRDYPQKVINLQIDDQTMPPSNKGFAFRFELNPLVSLGGVGYGMFVPPALHFEYHYISLGGGYNWMKYTKTDEKTKLDTKVDLEDAYATIRLITPSMWRLKFFASGTYGQYTRKKLDSLDNVAWKETVTYQGLGGGFRGYVTPRWSVHAEYFNISTIEKTRGKDRENRVVAGFAYEF